MIKRKYKINDNLNFGQFSGTSIQRLFIGAESITSEEAEYLNTQYKNILEEISNLITKSNTNEFILKLPVKSEIKHAMGTLGFHEIMRLKDHFMSHIISLTKVSQKGYIEWCIEKTEDFCIHPSDLNELYSLETYNHKSIIVTNVKQHNGQWSADFQLDGKKETHILTDEIRDINKLKFDNIYN